MERPEISQFTSLDFKEWKDSGTLHLTPKFQRREVWKPSARSFFIDSLLKDVPIPPIFLRLAQSEDRKRAVREVVDGQQRLRAVLAFMDDDFALSKAAPKSYAGKRFSQLSDAERSKVATYGFITAVFRNITDADVLQIFARVNTNAIKLNAQEIRNGTYFGFFKQAAYDLAFEHVEFWTANEIFSNNAISRMLEVEFTSELLIAQLDGLQDKKKSIDTFYADLDEAFPARDEQVERFRTTIGVIGESLGEVLADGEFSRVPLFYTLYCATYHRLFGLPKFALATPKRKKLSAAEVQSLRTATETLSGVIESFKKGAQVAKTDSPFVTASIGQTDNIGPRATRLTRLYEEAFG